MRCYTQENKSKQGNKGKEKEAKGKEKEKKGKRKRENKGKETNFLRVLTQLALKGSSKT